jgi:hypothetical protein
MTPYETIATFGLLGPDALDTLPITNPDADADAAIDHAFAALHDSLIGTLIAVLDLEPLLWGFVNLFHRHAARLERDRDEIATAIRRLVAEFDGSEIGDVEIQEAQRSFARTDERHLAISFMLTTVMERYETAFGKPWFPRSGTITGRNVTAAMIDARDFIAAAKQREVEARSPEGARVIVTGGVDFQDHDAIWSALDRTRDRLGDMVLLHGGATRGVDHIASLWARERGVPQVAFRPDFAAHKRAAPFKRNDEMLGLKPRAVIVFPGNGISENVAQKAEIAGVPVWRPVQAKVGAA